MCITTIKKKSVWGELSVNLISVPTRTQSISQSFMLLVAALHLRPINDRTSIDVKKKKKANNKADVQPSGLV